MIRKTLHIALTIIILGGCLLLAAFAGTEQRYEQYHSFVLRITNPQETPLITDEELNDTLVGIFGKITGKNLNSVPIFEIEDFLRSHPYVSSTNVYSTLNGGMSASVIVRVPLLRIFNSSDESFLIDTSGIAMPVSKGHPVRLLAATGNIPGSFKYSKGKVMNVGSLQEGSVIRDLYRVARLIAEDDFISALITQIYVNDNNELELIPQLGDQVIIFGTAEGAVAKLEKLKAFYLQVANHAGWDTYKTINLTFENQVVCSK